MQTAEFSQVINFYGPFSRRLVKACLCATRSAGFLAGSAVMVNKVNAVCASPMDPRKNLYVRLRQHTGDKSIPQAVAWTFDPNYFSQEYGARARLRMQELLADPTVTIKKVNPKSWSVR